MSALALSNPPDGITLSITAEALLQKQNALMEGRLVVAVTDGASQEIAVAALGSLKAFQKSLESSRTEIKKPVLELGKRIDAKAKEVGAEVEAEIARLNGLVRDFQREELARAERARVAAEKMARAKREREEAEAQRMRDEEERLRLEAEAADDPSKARALTAAADTARELRESAEDRAAEVVTKVVAAPPKAAGMAVAKVWKFTVTDVHALYAARPDLCVVEASASKINAELRAGMRECAGLAITEEITTTVRSS